MFRDYLKELNEAQLDAVTHTEGPAMVIAGAGSGKTTGADLPCGSPAKQGRPCSPHPRSHIHQQGGRRDERAH